ncbi:MAG: hypothetical protein UV70_C0003G0099 [Parcubacteria group bacterium GW2011_GWA2_43_13]|nr:MAG: hypothetical protein UV70_C0003G0099 [Parcubacteria group bacterium GW2011_GWA2_43_13]
MAKTKYIVFTADVQTIQSAKLRQAITDCINQKYEEIYFLISSGGGNVFEGLSLAAYINALPMKTIMHNIGQVDSVATAIFASGKERIGSKNASFMFHGVSMNLEKSTLIQSQLKELHDSSKKLKEDIAKGVSTYTGIELSIVEALMIDGGITLTAEEAKTKGFISNIAEPAIPANADIISISNG